MSDLLHIEVSPLGDHSISRSISKEFLATFTAKNPDAAIVTRDLASDSIPHLDGETINAAYTPKEERTFEAEAKHGFRMALVEEVNNAKHILVSTPMWNYSVPSVLKAWIDQIIVPGTTKVTGKVTIIISQGGSATEIVGSQEFGLLVRPEDAFDLQRQLKTLVEDAGLRKEMGRKARLHVMESYDRKLRLHRTLALYERGFRRRNYFN